MPNQYMSQLSDYDQIRLVWTDLNGVGRGITMPADEAEHALEEGVGFANGVAELTLEPALLDDPKYGAEAGDMMAIPDPESVTPLEWTDDTAAVFTNLQNVDGSPFDLCGRTALRRVLDDLESEGSVRLPASRWSSPSSAPTRTASGHRSTTGVPTTWTPWSRART